MLIDTQELCEDPKYREIVRMPGVGEFIGIDQAPKKIGQICLTHSALSCLRIASRACSNDRSYFFICAPEGNLPPGSVVLFFEALSAISKSNIQSSHTVEHGFSRTSEWDVLRGD